MSYLEDYLSFANVDEAPEMFYVWTAYASLSAAIGRRVWLPRPPAVIYPNIYLLLVGNAGEGKSQALGKMQWVVAKAGDIQMSSSVETPEGLLRYMAGDSTKNPPVPSECVQMMTWPDGVVRETHSMMIVANEFIDFIRTNMESWTGFLNNVYDQDVYKYRTKSSGTDNLVGPYVVLVGAIPTDVSKKLQDMDIINTGFGRRTIMQHGDRKFDRPMPRPPFTEEHEAARNRCVERLRALRFLKGAFTELPEAAKVYDDWYCEHSVTLIKRATTATRGWLASKPTQVTKIAILDSLSDGDDLVITPKNYETALAFLEYMETGLPKVFGGFGRNDLGPIAVQVLDYLTGIGEPRSFKTIQMKFFHSFSPGKATAELTEVLQYLMNTDQVIEHKLTIGSMLAETVYLTPAALEKFRAESSAQQAAAVLNGMRLDSSGEVRP